MTVSTDDIDKLAVHWTATDGIQRDLIETRLRSAIARLKEVAVERDAIAKERDIMFTNLGHVQGLCTRQELELRDRRRAIEGNPDDPSTEEDRFARDVVREIYRARQKYPKVYVSALLEEAGEVARAFNDNESTDRIRQEAIDTACVAGRLALEGCSHFAAVRGVK